MPYVTSVERMASRRGWQQGARAGLQEGRREGKLEGRLEGQVELLTRQLTRRFGPLPAAVGARLSQASAADLADWGERLMGAASLDEVFGERDG